MSEQALQPGEPTQPLPTQDRSRVNFRCFPCDARVIDNPLRCVGHYRLAIPHGVCPKPRCLANERKDQQREEYNSNHTGPRRLPSLSAAWEPERKISTGTCSPCCASRAIKRGRSPVACREP